MQILNTLTLIFGRVHAPTDPYFRKYIVYQGESVTERLGQLASVIF